jgi:hypothetical protein
MTVTLAPLDDLAAALKAGGVRSASTNPAEINTPGVWIRLTGISFDLLGGYTLNTVLHLVVADNGVQRSAVALVALLNKVTAVVDPSDTVTPAGVTLPANPAPLPGLAVPFDLTVSI